MGNTESGPTDVQSVATLDMPTIDTDPFEIIPNRTYVDAVMNRNHVEFCMDSNEECDSILPANYIDAQKLRENLQCICRMEPDNVIADHDGFVEVFRDVSSIEQVICEARNVANEFYGTTLSYYLLNIWIPEVVNIISHIKTNKQTTQRGTISIPLAIARLKPEFVADGPDMRIDVAGLNIRPSYRNAHDSTKVLVTKKCAKYD